MRQWWRRVGIPVGVVGAILAVICMWTTWPRDLLGAPLTLHESAAPADVIIVLGAGTRQNDNNYLPSQAEQRVAEGASLLKQGVAQHIIFSGGLSPTTKLVEADLMAALAQTDGVPSLTIITERQSRDTWQNAQDSLAIMKANNWKTAVVVTSPYHTRRACHFFRKQKATVRCIAAPYSLVPNDSLYEKFMDNRSVIREYGAWVYAWLQGRV